MARLKDKFGGGRRIALALGCIALCSQLAIQTPSFAQGAYDPTMRGRGGFNPLNPSAGSRSSSDKPAPKYDPSDEYLGLPRTDGVDTVFTQCTPCHSAATFMQQNLSRSSWDKLINWMVESRGMLEPEPEDRKIILDYLTKHFGAEL